MKKFSPLLSSLQCRSALRLGSWALSCFLILAATSAYAQSADAPQDSGPPSGPLLATAPAFSQWIVTFTYPEDKAPKAPGASASPPDSRTRIVTTTKTHQIIHEEFVDGIGGKFEEWHDGTNFYVKSSGAKLWSSFGPNDTGGNGVPYFEPLPASGFRDLNWINLDNYTGTLKFSGGSYLVFTLGKKLKITPNTPLSQIESLNAYALINADTRLPVQVKANGITRVYQFKDAPTERLTLPPDLADEIKKGEEGLKRLNQPMPPP